MVLKNDSIFFKSLGFNSSENYDKNCSEDTYNSIYLKNYFKSFTEGAFSLQVSFYYKVCEKGSRTLVETSVCFFGTDADIETNIITEEGLKLFLKQANEITKYFKKSKN